MLYSTTDPAVWKPSFYLLFLSGNWARLTFKSRTPDLAVSETNLSHHYLWAETGSGLEYEFSHWLGLGLGVGAGKRVTEVGRTAAGANERGNLLPASFWVCFAMPPSWVLSSDGPAASPPPPLYLIPLLFCPLQELFALGGDFPNLLVNESVVLLRSV